MEVITVESKVYQELMTKINLITKFIAAIESKSAEQSEDGWVDSYEICTFLKISARTLQRLRAEGKVSFSRIRGKNYYRISEVRRMLQDNVIRRSDEHFEDLVKNYRLHVEQRRNLKANK